VDPGSRLALAVFRFARSLRRPRLDQPDRLVNHLDYVHARIMLTEMLRDTAPEVRSWGEELLRDAWWLAAELEDELREEVQRRAGGGKGGGLERA
jgi:hypothetical protein